MRVLVVGAGAIGGTLAGHLAGAGHDLVALDGWTDHINAINSHGLRVEGVRGSKRFALRAVPYEAAAELKQPADLVFICVKSQDTDRAVELVTHLVGDSTMVVSTQNGLNEERLVELLGPRPVVGAVTEMGGSLPEAGLVMETRKDGGFIVGELDGTVTPRVRRLAQVMAACAPTHVSSNITGILWSKLLWNCMLNAGSGVSGLGQGQLITDDERRAVLVAVGREVVRVALAAGVRLEPLQMMGIDPAAMCSGDPGVAAAAEAVIVDRYRSQMAKVTSMLQDVQKGRPTEIDFLNGFVAAKARRLGLETPLNEHLVQLIHRIESGQLRPEPKHLEELSKWRTAVE